MTVELSGSEHRRGTQARRKIMQELARRYHAKDCPPSYAELAELIGLTMTPTARHISLLREAGYIHDGCLWLTTLGHEAVEN